MVVTQVVVEVVKVVVVEVKLEVDEIDEGCGPGGSGGRW